MVLKDSSLSRRLLANGRHRPVVPVCILSVTHQPPSSNEMPRVHGLITDRETGAADQTANACVPERKATPVGSR